MSNSNHQQLIHDLIDGQLPEDQAQHVRQLMADDAELAALFQSLKDQQLALRSLPTFTLDESFADQVVSAAQSQGLLSEKNSPPKIAVTSVSGGWWTPVAVIGTLAAMLLVTLFVIPNLDLDPSIASTERADFNSSAESESNETAEEELSEDDRPDNIAESANRGAGNKLAGRKLEKSSDPQANPMDKAGALMDDSKSFSDAPKIQQLQNNLAEADAEKVEPQKNALESNPRQAFGGGVAKGSDEDQQAPSNRARSMMKKESPGNIVQRAMKAKPEAMLSPTGELAAQTGPQVMVFNITQEENNIRRINQMLTENGIGVELPATQEEQQKRLASNEKKQFIDPRTYAYHVRATPEQMQKAVLALNQQSDIVAIDAIGADAFGGPTPMNALQSTQELENQLAGGAPARGQELGTRKFTRQSQAPAESLADATSGAGFGGGGGEGSEDNQDSKDGDEHDAKSKADAARELASKDTVREIDQYFGLENQEDRLARRSYTLIFMLKNADVAPPSPADNAEAADATSESDK